MPNLTSVGITAGVPTSGTGTVSTLDQVLAQGVPISDGTATNIAAIKAASTAPLATDKSLVVAISPNGQNTNGQKTMSGSAPVVVASDQAPVPTLVGVSASLNGATPSRINSAASTNATSLKASSGQIYSIDVYNSAAYAVYLKLYNKASAPTVGTDTPAMTIPIASGGGYSKTWQTGFPFSVGIAYAITKSQADSDTTVVVAGDLTGNTIWI